MRKILGIAGFLLLIQFSSLFAQTSQQVDKETNQQVDKETTKSLDKIAAVVGGTIILKSDIDAEYANYLSQGNQPNSEMQCYIIQQLLTQKLLSQQAVIDSVTVSDDELEDEINRRMRVMISRAGGQERLEQFLNRSVIEYKDQIRNDVREQLVANKMQGKITSGISVTPMEVKRYFETLPKDSLPYFNTEVEIGEIAVNPKLTKEEKESFRSKAEALRERLKAGEDFGTLARLYSQDPGSAKEGGDLGFADRGSYVKEFAAMAFKLKPGDISPVFETEFGFHILQVMERRGEQVRARHILIKTEPTPASITRLKAHVDSIQNMVLTKKIDFSTAASLYSDNNETKYNGGMMLNAEDVQTRTTFIPMDKLEPDVFLSIDTAKVGTFTQPYLYTARDGKQGYRFFYLKSKTVPHQASLEQDLPKIKDAAMSDKINRILSEWFEKRRQTTYIRIDPEYQSCSTLKVWVTTTATATNK